MQRSHLPEWGIRGGFLENRVPKPSVRDQGSPGDAGGGTVFPEEEATTGGELPLSGRGRVVV